MPLPIALDKPFSLTQDFLVGLARLLFYTFTISHFLLDPVKSNGDLHVMVQKVVQ